jgi:hypothetical protein
MRHSRPIWIEREFEAAVEEVLAGKTKVPERIVSSSVKGGAEVEEKRGSKGLKFEIPKYSYGDMLGRVRGLTVGEDTKEY